MKKTPVEKKLGAIETELRKAYKIGGHFFRLEAKRTGEIVVSHTTTKKKVHSKIYNFPYDYDVALERITGVVHRLNEPKR